MASLFEASWNAQKLELAQQNNLFKQAVKYDQKEDALRCYSRTEKIFEGTPWSVASFLQKKKVEAFRKKIVSKMLKSLCKKGWLDVVKEDFINEALKNPSDILTYIEKEFAENYKKLSETDNGEFEQLEQLEEAFNCEKNKLQNLDITLKEKQEIEKKIEDIAANIYSVAQTKLRVWETELKEGEKSQNITVKRQQELQTRIAKLKERVEPSELILSERRLKEYYIKLRTKGRSPELTLHIAKLESRIEELKRKK